MVANAQDLESPAEHIQKFPLYCHHIIFSQFCSHHTHKIDPQQLCFSPPTHSIPSIQTKPRCHLKWFLFFSISLFCGFSGDVFFSSFSIAQKRHFSFYQDEHATAANFIKQPKTLENFPISSFLSLLPFDRLLR